MNFQFKTPLFPPRSIRLSIQDGATSRHSILAIAIFLETKLYSVKGVECPYRHGENVKTNSRLKAYLAPLLKSSDNIGCGVLCINAVYLINHGTSWSPSIPQALIKKSIPVVTFSLRNMPNLRRIICWGNVASRSWAILAAAEPELASSKVVFRVPHPAARISRDEKLRQWLEVTRFA